MDNVFLTLFFHWGFAGLGASVNRLNTHSEGGWIFALAMIPFPCKKLDKINEITNNTKINKKSGEGRRPH